MLTTILTIASLHATTIIKYSIAPLNRLTMKFDRLPNTIGSELSDNKLMLMINLGDAVWTKEKEFVNSDGIIKQATLSNSSGSTLLTLSFTEKRGFTIAKFPYSQTLVVDVFDWNKLNAAEEAYRMALLSIIDGSNDIAHPDLLTAINGDVADAATMRGFALLSEGKINSALRSFLFAEIKGGTFADNFAALSQIYAIKKDPDNADKYAKLYKQKTGEINVPVIEIPPLTESGDAISEPMPYIDSIIAANAPIIDTDTTTADTTKQAVTTTDTTKTEESIWAAENYLLTKYVVGIIIAAILLIVYLYLKWRNKQLLALQQLQQKQQNTPPAQPAPTPAKKKSTKPATNAEPDAEQTKSDNKQKNTKQNFNDTLLQQMSDATPPPPKPQEQTKTDYKKNADELLSLIDAMKEEDVIKSDSILQAEMDAMAEQSGLSNYKASSTAYNIAKQSPQKKRSANIELADRLANEQKRIKSEKLANINNAIELDATKINEIAKNLGVEQGSLETKQNLEALSANKDEFAKLSAKFGVKLGERKQPPQL